MAKHVFFVGIGGSGMNGIARVLRLHGYHVRGSDREFDRGARSDFYASMQRIGIILFPQNGSGITPDLDSVVTSTAVEADIPDIVRARELGIPVIHRSEALSNLIDSYTSIAVAGTSGKSTVTGMCGWCLSRGGYDPLVLNGAHVLGMAADGSDSDICAGTGQYAVFEADESDRSLLRFTPSIGILTNITVDHMPLSELRNVFSGYIRNIRDTLILNADCAESRTLNPSGRNTLRFGIDHGADFTATAVTGSARHISFRVEDRSIHLAMPGRHNVYNALACYTLLRHLGIPPGDIEDLLNGFRGIRRRFQVIGSVAGVTVVDDFAHNPDKIRSTMAAARHAGKRRIYVFQPHGFGPTRFLFEDLAAVFAQYPESTDRVILTPVFYAGGTVSRDVSSDALAERIHALGGQADVCDRNALPDHILEIHESDDWVIVMGARDPSLTQLCQSILETLASRLG
ncbi:UDP-N-acetylmuramate--alanine ligase [bacterium]|nr:UDP-N-acetylmuramate--alanine ligase [candidate division CSSED10-310 bacterium]